MLPSPSDRPHESPSGPVTIRGFLHYLDHKTRVQWTAEAGHPARDYIPPSWVGTEDLRIIRNGLILAADEWGQIARPGDELIVYQGPAGTAMFWWPAIAGDIAGLALGTSLFFPQGWAMMYDAAFGPGSKSREVDSPTYGWGEIRNTWGAGVPIQTVYGTHRVGGHFIQQFSQKARVVPAGYSNPNVGELSTLLALSIGPIESVDDLHINKNPASDYGEGLRWLGNIRLGLNHQAPVDGFHEIVRSSFRDVVVEYAGGPQTFTTSDTIDRFELQFRFQAGLYGLTTKGDMFVMTVGLRIEYRELGSTTWTLATTTPWAASGATRNPTDVWWRSELLPRAVYEIRITRQTVDDYDPSLSSRVSVYSINEIIDEALTYPGIALIGVQQLPTNLISGQIPTYDVLVKGRLVYTWTSGVKSTERVWSDNPAWCAIAKITDPPKLGGLGAYLTEDDLLLDEFEAWATYCTANSLSCNFVDDGTLTPVEVLHQIALIGHANLYLSGSRWGVKIDQPAEPVQFFSMGRIHKKSFSVSKRSKLDSPNVLIGEFRNAALDYEADAVRLEDPLMEVTDEIREETVSCIGATSEAQVRKILERLLLKNRLERRVVELEVGIDALASGLGDVVKVAHDVPGWGRSGKILQVLDANVTTIVLDREVTIEAGKTYELTVAVSGTDTPDVVRVVSNPGTSATIVVDGGWSSSPPSAGADYSFGEVEESVKLYRIFSITHSSDPTKRHVRLTEYDARVYDSDLSVLPAPSPTWRVDPQVIPSDPTGLRLNERQSYAQDGTLSAAIDVHWTMPPEAGARCQVWWRESEDPVWILAGDPVDRGYFSITDSVQTPGITYEVSVVPVSPSGNRKHPDLGARATITTAGTTRQPGRVLSFTVDRTLEGLVFTWEALDQVVNFDLDYYEIRDGATWDTGILVGRTTETKLVTTSFRQGTRTFQIKGVNTAGIASATAAVVVMSVEGRIGENIVFTRSEAPTWGGIKEAFSVDGDDNLVLDTEGAQVSWRATAVAAPFRSQAIPGGYAPQYRLTGIYTTEVFAIASTALRCLITTDLELDQVDLTMTWAALTDKTWESDFGRSHTWAVQATDRIRTKLEMRFSTTTSADSAFGPWAERAENIEALVRYAQARVTVTITDPSYSVMISKMDLSFDVPDVVESGAADTVGTGTVAVAYAKAFNAIPKVTALVVPATAGDEVFVTDKTLTGFDLAVRNGGSLVVRAVDWMAIGY